MPRGNQDEKPFSSRLSRDRFEEPRDRDPNPHGDLRRFDTGGVQPSTDGETGDNVPRARFSPQRTEPFPHMARILAVMLIGLLPGCAQYEAQLERDALDATVTMATNDDEFCRSTVPSREPRATWTAA
jgi:hypothetical protein